MGARVPTDGTLESELVVRVLASAGADDPVPDSMILVATRSDGDARARYLSWIVGYADLDEASTSEPGRWTIVEPAREYEATVGWLPYGWGPLESVWTHPPPPERRARDLRRNGARKLKTVGDRL